MDFLKFLTLSIESHQKLIHTLRHIQVDILFLVEKKMFNGKKLILNMNSDQFLEILTLKNRLNCTRNMSNFNDNI